MGWRMFVFDEGGALRQIPQRVANYLPTGGAKLAEYAGKRLRYALVQLETEAGKPSRIVGATYGYFEFDRHGSAQPAIAKDAARVMANMAARQEEEAAQEGPVVPITARLERRAIERDLWWAPTEDDVAKINRAIWPRDPDSPGKG